MYNIINIGDIINSICKIIDSIAEEEFAIANILNKTALLDNYLVNETLEKVIKLETLLVQKLKICILDKGDPYITNKDVSVNKDEKRIDLIRKYYNF